MSVQGQAFVRVNNEVAKWVYTAMSSKEKRHTILFRLGAVAAGLFQVGISVAQLISERSLHPAATDRTLAVVPIQLLGCALGAAALWRFRSWPVPTIVFVAVLNAAISLGFSMSRHVVSDRMLSPIGTACGFALTMGCMPYLRDRESVSGDN